MKIEINKVQQEIAGDKVNGFLLLKQLPKDETAGVIALSVNNVVQDLSSDVAANSKVVLIKAADKQGLEIARHSTSHVLAAAVQEIYGKDVKLAIGPAIEDGFYYDFDKEGSFAESDLVQIEEKMKEIIKKDDKFSFEIWPSAKAISYFEQKGEKYKVELIKDLKADEVTVYQMGNFVDLCKGPHVPSTRYLKNFKLTKVSGAYWRGDSKNKMLQRIYGVAFSTKEDLESYTKMLEEAEKRDHRKLGREMDLFHFEPDFAPGATFWHHNGFIVYRLLIEHIRAKQETNGYSEVSTPGIMDRSLWETSGHWQKYGEHNYSGKTEDGRTYCIKPMNCPGGILIYKQGIKSYKDLPMKVAEFGKVHRYEASGALSGLFRVREFTQDDAHVYCTPAQLEEESVKLIKFVLEIYAELGFKDVLIKLATRPENRIGSDEIWDLSEKSLKDALEKHGYKYVIAEGDGAFYGPKLEFHLKDAIGRLWQCGTVQVDMNLPERFDMNYIGEDGQKHRPVMLHRAIFGSIERFLGIFIEQYAGNLPLWVAPVQVLVTGLTNDFDAYAEEVSAQLKAAGFRVQIDKSKEKVGYKVRQHSLRKVPYIFVVGQKEKDSGTVAIRTFGSEAQEVKKLDVAIKELEEIVRLKK